MKKLQAVCYFVVSENRRTVHLNGGATKRKAIKCFMKEWGASGGPGATWAYWRRAGYRAIPFRMTEIAFKARSRTPGSGEVG